MAKIDSHGAGDSGKPRPQVQSSVGAEKTASTAAESRRGDTAGSGSGGPTELPAQFGRYRVKRKLGGGGMGTVYLVENTQLRRDEALKVPHFGDGDGPERRERFLREATSAARLDHANLCPVYDAGVQDGIYYLTMRFLEGKLLSDYAGTAQPARKAVETVTKLALALEAAHGKDVIHRDLKPSNIMMVRGTGPVVMDFGLAKQVQQPAKKLTQSGSMLGTPSYMPPEQVNGDLARMGPASDVYSLGVILYELLTGRLPFEGTMGAIFGQILYTEPPVPSTLVPGLHPALDGICGKAMAKESTERYASMKAFAVALVDFLHSTPATEGTGNLVPTPVDKAVMRSTPAVTGAGKRVPTGVDKGIFDAKTVAPGRRPATTVRAPRNSTQLRERSAQPTQSPLPWVLAGVAVLAAGLIGTCFFVTLILPKHDPVTVGIVNKDVQPIPPVVDNSNKDKAPWDKPPLPQPPVTDNSGKGKAPSDTAVQKKDPPLIDAKPANPVPKRIQIGQYWNPEITIKLESIDFRTAGKMTWHFTIWNQTGADTDCLASPTPVMGAPGTGFALGDDTYAVDQDGKKCKFLWDSTAGQKINLPAGVKEHYKVDFEAPRPGAKKLTAYFATKGGQRLPGSLPNRLLPTTEVEFP